MVKRGIFNLLIFLFFIGTSSVLCGAQELNCIIEVNAEQVENTSRDVFKTLQQAINEYMNTTAFTSHNYSTTERIECRLYLTIKEYNNENVTAELQVQSVRPVYNSSYTTTVLNFKDNNVQFPYREFDQLTFSTTTMESQLTAILNFYAYLILAMDYDTFSPHGGDEFYTIASRIVQMAQSSGETGWRMFEDNRNRPAVLSALTDPATEGLRDILYNYHRKGLDEMTVAPDKARSVITEQLTKVLPQVYSNAPMGVGPVLFRDTKLDEIVNIYTKGPESEKKKVVSALEEIYPTDVLKF